MSQAKLGAPPQGTRRSGIPAAAKPATDNRQRVLGAGTSGRGVRGLEEIMRQKPRPPHLGFGGKKQRGLTLLRLGRSPTPDIAGAVGDEAATGEQSELAKAFRNRDPPQGGPPPTDSPGKDPPRRHPAAPSYTMLAFHQWGFSSGWEDRIPVPGEEQRQGSFWGEGLCTDRGSRTVWDVGHPIWPQGRQARPATWM